MLPTLAMKSGPPSDVDESFLRVTFGIVADLALVTLLMKFVLVTFSRCLGRVDESDARRIAPSRTDPTAVGFSLPAHPSRV
jgi:hypothetical protein